jgi:hypothetical protein
MSIVFTATTTLNANGLDSLTGQVQDSGSTYLKIDKTIAGGVTDGAQGISFNGATLKAIILVANQNLTIKVNSTGSPFATINLLANVPYRWSAAEGYFANPLNVSVTEFYATTGSVTTRLQGRVLN